MMDSTLTSLIEMTTAMIGVNDTNVTCCNGGVDDRVAWIKSTVMDCYFYSMGVVIPTGLLANAFCLTVCALSHGLRRTTTGHYLMALAIADSLFLAGDLVRWLNLSDSSGRYRLPVSRNVCNVT